MKRALLRATAAAALLLLLVTALALPRLGAWLVVEDPLAKADGIYVLGGTMYERPLEARDLYTAGWAPTIVLVQQIADWGERWLTEPRHHGHDASSRFRSSCWRGSACRATRSRSVKPMDSTRRGSRWRCAPS